MNDESSSCWPAIIWQQFSALFFRWNLQSKAAEVLNTALEFAMFHCRQCLSDQVCVTKHESPSAVPVGPVPVLTRDLTLELATDRLEAAGGGRTLASEGCHNGLSPPSPRRALAWRRA